jgi:hypothetical protein
MVKGTASLQYTVLGFLVAGWSRLTLFFQAPDRTRLPVVDPDTTLDAFHCDSCDTTVIVK